MEETADSILFANCRHVAFINNNYLVIFSVKGINYHLVYYDLIRLMYIGYGDIQRSLCITY